MHTSRFRTVTAAAIAACAASASADGLRVAAWNITFYDGTQAQAVRDAVYGTQNGLAFDPNIILLQEMTSVNAVRLLAQHMNSAPGSPGDWVAAPTFVNATLNTALVYRTNSIALLDTTLVSAGSGGSNHPRNVVRHDMRIAGYESDEAIIAFYSTHMKAGSTATDQARRLVEANVLVNDIQSLPAGPHYVLGGDFNTQSSAQASFRTLVGSPYNTGPFLDPITVPGNWQNSSAFRTIHTQDPATQMDDRYDIILLSPSLLDGVGSDYIGDFSTPWDLSRWDDPNHSYRCWGNDGTTYNNSLRVNGNAMVNPATAQALIDLSSGGGHLPVYLDIRVPPRLIVITPPVNLGDVTADETRLFDITAGNAGDVAAWGADGIEDLVFTLEPGPGIAAPTLELTDPAGGAFRTVNLQFSPAGLASGVVSSFVDIVSNDPDSPTVRVPVTATITGGPCSPADVAQAFGALNVNDVVEFVNAFNAQTSLADLSPAGGDGEWNVNDVITFVNAFNAGCP